jgi:glycogen phosphorylase
MQIGTFQVVPKLPEKIKGLRELAYNLVWTWNDEMRVLFTRMDRELWHSTYQNPVLMLGTIPQARLEELAEDDGFLALYNRTYQHFQSYMSEPTWWDKRYKERPLIAYFSAEFGLAECLPIYSGGLGVLAGHHLKSASDLGVPLVGVGLAYQKGYFNQYLTTDGWQQESYHENDFYNLPLDPVLGRDGAECRIELEMLGRPLVVRAWKAQVGRVPLYLLDTNLPENPPDLQDITDQLYGGDHENRLRQELVLGMGGFRMLRALGLKPTVCHINEGHAAFVSLERIRTLMEEGEASFDEALEAIRAGSLFTTHTPVPAGFDVFSPELLDRYFSFYLRDIGVSRENVFALGRDGNGSNGSGFNMAALALRSANHVNAVSKLHGEVSRELFQRFMPAVPEHEVPIGHVTNGAHTRSAVSQEMSELFDRYLGPDWWRHPGQPETWEGVNTIPDEELWNTHERRRERLVAFARQRLMKQVEQRGGTRRDIERARGALDTRALTIGFSRRFATYKRASLLFSDLERLRRIILDADRPVQVIFAGKAHPKDTEAKEMLKAVFRFCQGEDVRRHLVFLEDYDLVIARYLVQGVDVWLNTPRRGMEASGTSGMKVLPNGGLNLSILDGWWPEGYEPEVGWAIGKGESYDDTVYQDQVESAAIYELLEKEVVPLFYARDEEGLPRAWIARMKQSIRKLTPLFSTNRMLFEYVEKYYLPAARHYKRLTDKGMARAKEAARWRAHVTSHWSEVSVESVAARCEQAHCVGKGYEVEAVVRLGSITPPDVAVEVYYGPLDADREIYEAKIAPMVVEAEAGSGKYRFTGVIPCERSGMQGYTVRVRPSHADAPNLMSSGLVVWW